MKLVAVLVLALASTTFGAVLVAPAQVDASSGTAVVTLAINNPYSDAADGLNGYSLKGVLPAGAVTITGRTNLLAADGITDATNVDGLVVGKDLSTVADLGYTGVPFSTAVTRSGNFLTLTLSVPTAKLPVTINWEGTLVSTFLTETPVTGTTTLVNVPEPISALLLGLGSLFFARRRRA